VVPSRPAALQAASRRERSGPRWSRRAALRPVSRRGCVVPKRVLIQLDCDPQPSTFDSIVAVDAGADVLLRHGGVTPEAAVPLVHGGMFTRGVGDLANTAIFVGGSNVAAAEAVARKVAATFFGPVRVGVLVDPSGANTTAAAAVIAALRHVGTIQSARAVVLGGTGPVGQRVGRLLARKGLRVTLGSRSVERAEAAAAAIVSQVPGSTVRAVASLGSAVPGSPLAAELAAADVVVAAGAAGAVVLDAAGREAARSARVLMWGAWTRHRMWPAGDCSSCGTRGCRWMWVSAAGKRRH